MKNKTEQSKAPAWTPGIWKAHVAADGLNVPDSVNTESGLHVCDVASYGAAPSQRHANARLIAQAPAMAALLAQQLENIEGDLDWAEQEGDEGAVGVHKARMEPIRALLARLHGEWGGVGEAK